MYVPYRLSSNFAGGTWEPPARSKQGHLPAPVNARKPNAESRLAFSALEKAPYLCKVAFSVLECAGSQMCKVANDHSQRSSAEEKLNVQPVQPVNRWNLRCEVAVVQDGNGG